MALEGDSYWERTDTGTPTLSDVTQIELHQDTWGAGFTTYYDGMQFVASLSPDWTEGNASAWGTFAPVDGAATSVVNDTSFVRAGAQSIRFDTASGFDTGVTYPAAGNAHWDLSHKDSIFFWAYALNTNGGGFQGYQPIVVLKSSGGDVIYTPNDLDMPIGVWTLYQIPIAGGSHWTESFTDFPTLTDVNQVEIHQDTWGAGFTVYYDGFGFGSLPPSFTLSQYAITGGAPLTATVTLDAPAPVGGVRRQPGERHAFGGLGSAEHHDSRRERCRGRSRSRRSSAGDDTSVLDHGELRKRRPERQPHRAGAAAP